jgi:hypothetical protein
VISTRSSSQLKVNRHPNITLDRVRDTGRNWRDCCMLRKVHIANIEAFCDSIRDNIDLFAFEGMRRILDLLDVRGKLAIENEEKVIYVKCIIGQQLLSVAQTSHSSSTGVTATPPCVSLPMAPYL